MIYNKALLAAKEACQGTVKLGPNVRIKGIKETH